MNQARSEEEEKERKRDRKDRGQEADGKRDRKDRGQEADGKKGSPTKQKPHRRNKNKTYLGTAEVNNVGMPNFP